MLTPTLQSVPLTPPILTPTLQSVPLWETVPWAMIELAENSWQCSQHYNCGSAVPIHHPPNKFQYLAPTTVFVKNSNI